MRWGGSVSGEDNPWFLKGQLAHSKVPTQEKVLLRGSCDQYRLLPDASGFGPEESPRIPLKQSKVRGEMGKWEGLLGNQ